MDFSPGQAKGIYSPGYYKFYGNNENYTKAHNISEVILTVPKMALLLD
jgi:hypothetical protein